MYIMKRGSLKNNLKYLISAGLITLMTACGSNRNNDRTWSVYKADEGSSSYSPLDQINTSNVSQLKPAWSFAVNDLPKDAQPSGSQSNPIIVDGVMYTTSAKRQAYAIDAATGRQLQLRISPIF